MHNDMHASSIDLSGKVSITDENVPEPPLPTYSSVTHYTQAMHSSTNEPPVVPIQELNNVKPHLLTTDEKAELVKIGRWGQHMGKPKWSNLCDKIKGCRNESYPPDWFELVILGTIFMNPEVSVQSL